MYSVGSELFDEQDVTNLEGDSDDVQSDIVEEKSVVVLICHIYSLKRFEHARTVRKLTP